VSLKEPRECLHDLGEIYELKPDSCGCKSNGFVCCNVAKEVVIKLNGSIIWGLLAGVDRANKESSTALLARVVKICLISKIYHILQSAFATTTTREQEYQ